MIGEIESVSFRVMARPKENSASTDQINFRLKVSTIDRMERFKAMHELHPSLTQIVETAVNQYLDAKESELPLTDSPLAKPKKPAK